MILVEIDKEKQLTESSNPIQQHSLSKRRIILFDGICNLCDGFVNFVFARDPNSIYSFAPLQSELAKKLLYQYNLPNDLKTIVFVNEHDGRAYTHSTAVLEIARGLPYPWSYSTSMLYIPTFIRDTVYGMVSANRYLIFGKSKNACAYRPGLRKRFLDWVEPDEIEEEIENISSVKYV